MKFVDTFYRLNEPGTTSIGRQVALQSDEDGRILGLWIDGDHDDDRSHWLFMEQVIGRSYLKKRFQQVLARLEVDDEFRLAKARQEREMEEGA